MKKILQIIVLPLIMISATRIYSFSTLNEMRDYANKYPEFPTADNDNWQDPDYSDFHKSIQPTALDKIRQRFNLGHTNYWNPNEFKNLLEEVLEQRRKVVPESAFVEKIGCQDGDHFFIWGDLHASFHSLVRGLTWLAEREIISQSLTILKPNYYIVFNGDFINRSAYTLESLTVALILLKQNPTNVIYIQGTHEWKSHWMNFALKRELLIRAAGIDSDTKIPLSKPMSAFFATLPIALYLYSPDQPHDVIRISHRDRENPDIDERLMGNFFEKSQTQSPNTIEYYTLSKQEKSKDPVTITSIIETEEWRNDIRAIKTGLGLLNQDRGATAWSVLSSPILAHQKFFDFYFDAFAEVVIHSPIRKSTISLYNRDIRTKDPFQKVATYNMVSLSTQKPEEIAEDALAIGSSMSLVQGVPTMGLNTKRGMLLRIHEENLLGGINGKRIKSVVYNDDYTPRKTRANLDRLINEDKADIILLSVGTPTTSSLLPEVDKKLINVFFPITGSASLREEKYKGMIHFRPSYSEEVRALISYILKETSAKKFLFFYQNDAYGLGPLKTAHEELKKHGITDWVDVPYQRNSIDMKAQARKIKEVQPDVIGFFATGLAAQSLIRDIGIESLANKQLFGISFLGEEPFRQYLDEQGLSLMFGAVVPNPKTSQLEIVKKYRKAMDQYGYPYDVFSLEAYIATSIFLEAAKKVTPPITREKIINELEKLNNYDFGGIILTFDPKTRGLTQSIWIEKGNNVEWAEVKFDKRTDDSQKTDASKDSKPTAQAKPAVEKQNTESPQPENPNQTIESSNTVDTDPSKKETNQ